MNCDVTGTCIKCLLQESQTGGLVYHSQLIKKCLQLCEVMQYEFIFTKTCQALDSALNEVMESFLATDILMPKQVSICLPLKLKTL